VSNFVKENAGEKSETNVEETFGYMGRAMQKDTLKIIG
jgi:hypothetical protein